MEITSGVSLQRFPISNRVLPQLSLQLNHSIFKHKAEAKYYETRIKPIAFTNNKEFQMNIIRVRMLPLAISIFGLLHAGLASAEVTTFVSCANNGAGELVDLTGDLHALFIVNISSAGSVIVKTQFNPQGVIATGEITGNKYQGTGVTQSISTYDGITSFPYTVSFINNYRLIGQGSGANYLVHSNTHVTVNANGMVTATVDNTRIECK
jgi:hypothetical protein